jgi:hypothetical protein
MVVIDKQLYTPNTKDKSAFNYLSEWDYAIKPVLDEIKISHPKIKIENHFPDIRKMVEK